MPDLDFEITSAEPAAHGLTPLLQFKSKISNSTPDEPVQAALLHVQIQLQPPQRAYGEREKAKLVELFGAPDQWGQTLRNRLWTQTNATVGAFAVETEATLSVSCTYDLNIAATKYFFALDEGEVSLLFLFSGSVFYLSSEGRLQVEPVSWDKECVFRMRARLWHELMERHFPNSAWLSLRRDVFERLCDFKRANGIATWEEAVEMLLKENPEPGRNSKSQTRNSFSQHETRNTQHAEVPA